MTSSVMPGGGWIAGQCAWNGSTASFFLAVGTAASLQAAGDPTARDAAAKVEAFKAQYDDKVTELQGIGERALMSVGGLAAHDDGTYVEIVRLRLTDDQLVQIARIAIGNL